MRPEGQRVRITAVCRPFRFTGARSKKARSSGVPAVSGFRVGILQTSCVKLAFCKVFAVCWRFVNFLRRDWQYMYRLMSRRALRKLIYSGPMFAQSFLGWRYAYSGLALAMRDLFMPVVLGLAIRVLILGFVLCSRLFLVGVLRILFSIVGDMRTLL